MPHATELELTDRINAADAELSADGFPVNLTAEQTAAALGAQHPRTVARMIERGELSAFKLGNRWRIRRRELARYIVVQER